jgi:AcrR family transcriptional regulator
VPVVEPPEPIADPAGAAARGTRSRSGNAMGRTRAAIVSGTARCLAEHGARRTTMIDIAAASGVAKGTLYNHVRTKAEAYRLLGESEASRLVELLTADPDADRSQVLARAADVIAQHPVARRLAEQEPSLLAAVLLPGPLTQDAYGQIRAALVVLLGDAAGPLALRWLMSLLIDPGESADRTAAADLLAAHPR